MPVDPKRWTEIEYRIAAARYRELVRQRRWKEARRMLRKMRIAIRARLGDRDRGSNIVHLAQDRRVVSDLEQPWWAA